MKALIDKKININHKDNNGNTALHNLLLNSKQASEEVMNGIQLLINAGVNINAENLQKKRAIHVAVERGWLSICKTLIENGAEINAEALRKKRAIHQAAINGDAQICKMLIESGADINAQDKHGYSALHYIISSSHDKQLIEMFLSAGADTELQASDGRTAAQMTKKSDIVALLTNKSSVKLTR